MDDLGHPPETMGDGTGGEEGTATLPTPVQLTYNVLSAIKEGGGIRIVFEDQEWTYRYKTKCFTRKRPGRMIPSPGFINKMEVGPERIDRYKNRQDLINRLGHCKPLIEAIDNAMFDAILSYNFSLVA